MPFRDDKISRAVRRLRAADPVMKNLIRRARPFRARMVRNRFQALVHAIIAQQISDKAAESIQRRLTNYIAPQKISPVALSALTREEFRSAGISNQKTTYLMDLTSHVLSGTIRLERIGRLSDEQVIETLTQVKGIGVWTAQMFLIFSLGRLNVFPATDLGVRVALKNLYHLEELPTPEHCLQIASAWRPYATLGAWYCWRSLEIGKR